MSTPPTPRVPCTLWHETHGALLGVGPPSKLNKMLTSHNSRWGTQGERALMQSAKFVYAD